MKHLKLGDLLNPAQALEVTRILNSTADTLEAISRLTSYFNTFRDELVEKGVLPEYLAYVVEFEAQKQREHITRNN